MIFICRIDDVDSTLIENKDIFIIDIPRSADFKGFPGLFAVLLRRFKNYRVCNGGFQFRVCWHKPIATYLRWA